MFLKQIHKKNCYVYSVSEEVASTNREFGVLLKQAEHEANKLSKTIKDSFVRRRAQGAHIGPPPYGYTTVYDQAGIRRLTPSVQEQHGIIELKKFWNQYLNYDDVADRMNASKYPYRNREWTFGVVRTVLQRNGVQMKGRKRKMEH